MTEEKARADAEALASALGITFYVVRSGVASDCHFSAVQLPTAESEIIATVEPAAGQRALEDVPGFE
jgi:hypothetical protein